jgi:hypothetical protein
MEITKAEIEAARTCDSAMRTALEWWKWNDRNGLWEEALLFLDGATEEENPEGWDPHASRDELVDGWLESLEYYFEENNRK